MKTSHVGTNSGQMRQSKDIYESGSVQLVWESENHQGI